jgi:CelD/BcsL family acetyltransferase involved in cellulose biosynthesis
VAREPATRGGCHCDKGLSTLLAPNEIYVVDTFTNLDAVRSRWEALERRGASTPFQSFVWVSALMETVGRAQKAELAILIVRNRHSGEDLLLLPLIRRRARMLRWIETPDFGLSDYNSAILSDSVTADPGRLAGVWNAAMRALPAADVLHIRKIPELLADVPNPMLRLDGMLREFYDSWQLALPENFRDVEQHVLSASTRKQIRKRTRQLENTGGLSYVIAGTVAEKKKLFQILSEQRQARFCLLGRHNVLTSAPHRKFYDRILESPDNDVIAVQALKIGDEIIATAFGVRWQQRFYLLMSTMAHGKWMEMSPGVVLIWKLMQFMHEMGCRCFDFTIGDETYKHQLGGRPSRICEHIRCLSPAGLPYTSAWWTRRKLVTLKRWARDRRLPLANSVRLPAFGAT